MSETNENYFDQLKKEVVDELKKERENHEANNNENEENKIQNEENNNEKTLSNKETQPSDKKKKKESPENDTERNKFILSLSSAIKFVIKAAVTIAVAVGDVVRGVVFGDARPFNYKARLEAAEKLQQAKANTQQKRETSKENEKSSPDIKKTVNKETEKAVETKKNIETEKTKENNINELNTKEKTDLLPYINKALHENGYKNIKTMSDFNDLGADKTSYFSGVVVDVFARSDVDSFMYIVYDDGNNISTISVPADSITGELNKNDYFIMSITNIDGLIDIKNICSANEIINEKENEINHYKLLNDIEALKKEKDVSIANRTDPERKNIYNSIGIIKDVSAKRGVCNFTLEDSSGKIECFCNKKTFAAIEPLIKEGQASRIMGRVKIAHYNNEEKLKIFVSGAESLEIQKSEQTTENKEPDNTAQENATEPQKNTANEQLNNEQLNAVDEMNKFIENTIEMEHAQGKEHEIDNEVPFPDVVVNNNEVPFPEYINTTEPNYDNDFVNYEEHDEEIAL